MTQRPVSTFARMSLTGHNEAQREQKAEEAKRRELEAVDELRWLMSDKRGRRFMWRLLGEFGVFQQTYVPGDTHGSAFREGQRSMALKLTTRISEHCPDRMSEMQKEAREHATRSSSSSK